MTRLVAVLIDGKLTIHGPPSFGEYDTLCGLDGEDGAAGTSPAKVPPGARINCDQCRMIWLTAQQLHARDFA